MENYKNTNILVINAGSSSIKLSIFDFLNSPKLIVEAVIENIGQSTARFIAEGTSASDNFIKTVVVPNHSIAAEILLDWLKHRTSKHKVTVIGHRVVHGGPKYFETCIIDDEVLENLRETIRFNPLHLPVEIQLIETFRQHFEQAQHIVCFDTAFHHNLPLVARLFPIPRRYEALGIRRYGFHGLSYAFVLREIKRLDGEEKASGRLILAHLGSGVSLAAVRRGVSIDTTMGLTPAGGLPMSTRSGDLDPGIFTYLVRTESFDAVKFDKLVNTESGLLGLSGTTPDMEQLLNRENDDAKAKEAIDLFCYQVKKSIGSLAAALGGLDTLVFTGGMGEHAPKIRARICEGLDFLGIKLEESLNASNANLISTGNSGALVRVVHTDEALMIAQNIYGLLINKISS